MRALIAQTAFLGDVVLTTSLLARVQSEYPDAEIDVLVSSRWAEVMQGQAGVACVMAFDKRGGDRGVRGALRMAGALAARGYDLALAPHRSVRTAFVLAAAKIPRRIGFAGAPGAFLYTERVPVPSRGHYVDKLNALSIAFARSTDAPPAPRLRVDTAAAGRVAARLTEAGIEADARVAAVAPGSVWATKKWTPAGYAEVIRRFSRDGWRVILLGSSGDREAVRAVEAELGNDGAATNWVGRTDLPELIAALARADVFVGNDSGAMHVAGAVGTPVVAAFGPTVPELGFAPRAAASFVAQIELDCRPCHAHGPRRCPLEHHRCMRELSADTVWRGVEQVLAQARPS